MMLPVVFGLASGTDSHVLLFAEGSVLYACTRSLNVTSVEWILQTP